MDFNCKIISKIISYLEKATCHEISILKLQDNMRLNIGAADNTFPQDAMRILEDVFLKISNHIERQYVATLNTINKGSYDESLPVGELFKDEILALHEILHNALFAKTVVKY